MIISAVFHNINGINKYVELDEIDNEYLKYAWCAWYYDYIDYLRYTDADTTDIKRNYSNVDFLVYESLLKNRNTRTTY